jgi:hypothetical protein
MKPRKRLGGSSVSLGGTQELNYETPLEAEAGGSVKQFVQCGSLYGTPIKELRFRVLSTVKGLVWVE